MARPRRSRSWGRRLRRVAVGLLVLVVVVTLLSFGYNALTGTPRAAPAGLTYVQAGDVRTRYRAWGTHGTPIVLVHGFVESADTWQYVGPRLAAAGHRVYALDLDGWGYSQRVAPYDAGHQATQLLTFIAALHLRRPVLVGHSSGAAIVAMATLRRPASVGGVMFLDGDALSTGAGSQSPVTKLLIDPYRTSILRLVVRADWLIRKVYASACGASCPRLDAAGVDQWRRPLQVADAEHGLWAMLGLGVPGLPPATLAGLAALPIPKAVVFGAHDSVFAPASPTTTAARIGAPRPTLIPGAEHLTPVNSPGAVTAAVLALVRRA